MLVGFMEYRDRSFKNDDEVVRVLDLPVLAVVPQMISAVDRRRVLKRQVAMHAVLGCAFFGCLAVLAYAWIR